MHDNPYSEPEQLVDGMAKRSHFTLINLLVVIAIVAVLVALLVPAVYRCPSAGIPENATTYCGVVGEDHFFHPTQPRQISEITDGTSNTVMVFEVSPNEAVAWMSPQDTDQRFILTFGDDGICSRRLHAGGSC